MKVRTYIVTIPEEPDDNPHLNNHEAHRMVLSVILKDAGYKDVKVELKSVTS